jgi:hypothetical protein
MGFAEAGLYSTDETAVLSMTDRIKAGCSQASGNDHIRIMAIAASMLAAKCLSRI